MTTTVAATYEQGVLRLAQTLPLEEGTRVEVTVNVLNPVSAVRSPAELLAAIAALPLEGNGPERTSIDHDAILYGEAK